MTIFFKYGPTIPDINNAIKHLVIPYVIHKCPQGGGEGTLIFSYIRRFGFKILKFNILFGILRKKTIFCV